MNWLRGVYPLPLTSFPPTDTTFFCLCHFLFPHLFSISLKLSSPSSLPNRNRLTSNHLSLSLSHTLPFKPHVFYASISSLFLIQFHLISPFTLSHTLCLCSSDFPGSFSSFLSQLQLLYSLTPYFTLPPPNFNCE